MQKYTFDSKSSRFIQIVIGPINSIRGTVKKGPKTKNKKDNIEVYFIKNIQYTKHFGNVRKTHTESQSANKSSHTVEAGTSFGQQKR